MRWARGQGGCKTEVGSREYIHHVQAYTLLFQVMHLPDVPGGANSGRHPPRQNRRVGEGEWGSRYDIYTEGAILPG